MVCNRVLFIGNSYTYFNKMPYIFAEITKAAGMSVTADSVTKGGASLNLYYSEKNDYSKNVLSKLNENKYDYVILQDNSTYPIRNLSGFFTNVRKMSDLIKPYGAKPILYQTWARKIGHETLSEFSFTPEEMEMQLRSAYTTIAEEIGLNVSYVGKAFHDVTQSHPEIDLYDADLHHPSLCGSYLAACVLFSTLYKSSPVGTSYTAGLDYAVAEILQNAAYNIQN